MRNKLKARYSKDDISDECPFHIISIKKEKRDSIEESHNSKNNELKLYSIEVN